MKLSTQTHVLANTYGHEECVRILAGAGYDAIDISLFEMENGDGVWCTDEWRDHAKRLRALAGEYGMTFNQAHAPFPSTTGDGAKDEVIFERILRSMQVSAALGVRNIVVHPCHHIPYSLHKDELYRMNLDFYRRLIPYCEEYGIRACAENMWQYDHKRNYIVDSVCSQPEEFCALLDELDSPWIVGCLDIGHCALVGVEPDRFIRAMGAKRIQALHVHDVSRVADSHTMPFMQKLDWEPIACALGEIGYEGDLTFEADHFIAAFPNELKRDAAAMMVKVGRYLIGRVEAARK